jgi:hypothetical protein
MSALGEALLILGVGAVALAMFGAVHAFTRLAHALERIAGEAAIRNNLEEQRQGRELGILEGHGR